PFKIGNVYEMINDAGIQCIQIGIADEAKNNEKEIFGEVHAWDPVNGAWELRGYTDIVMLDSTDVGIIMNLPLLIEAPVYAGEDVLVVACHYGGAGDGSEDVSFMFGQSVEDGMVYGFNGAGDYFLLSSPRAIVARADFDCGLSVNELENGRKISIYPNPANDVVNVDLSSLEGEVSIEMMDVAGKVVASNVYSVANGGEIHVQLNTAKLAEGMYTLTISSGEYRTHRKVMVTH
ncbi:MAG: T9SS type A sorting domain-containing protein, partial [Crocinitomicaceae bacterium]|nr:T9SS type A sorting domain-containing protein [Crocinitomicaceae bacterium]